MDTVRFVFLFLKETTSLLIDFVFVFFWLVKGVKPHTRKEKKKKRKKKRRLIIVVHRPLTTVPSGSACSSRPLCLNFIVPRCMTAAVIFQISGLCSPIPKISKASYIFCSFCPFVERTGRNNNNNNNTILRVLVSFKINLAFWIEKKNRKEKSRRIEE